MQKLWKMTAESMVSQSDRQGSLGRQHDTHICDQGGQTHKVLGKLNGMDILQKS